MQINVTYDQPQSSLPAGFVAAINYVVNYYDSIFTNPVTVNIDVGYGEIAGQWLGSGALGASETYIDALPYSQVTNALSANAQSPAQAAAYATLPGSSPLGGGTLWMATAEEKALGLLPAAYSAIDGYVGFSSFYPFSYSATATPAANQYYFIGIVEHEFAEVMGRSSFLGDAIAGTTSYSLMDLFRYSAPGTRQLGTGGPAYFSIDNGATNLNNWNTNPNGDMGDWAASAGADAFLAFSPSGQIDGFSPADLTLMNVLGWDTSPPGPPTVTKVVASPAKGVAGIGQRITLTLDMSAPVTVTGGTPTLSLSDNGIATYDAAKSSSTALVFDYTVQSSDADSFALAVTGLSANGATITDVYGNGANLAGALATFAGLQIHTSTPVTWKTPVSGNFAAGANWNAGIVPGASNDAVMNPSGTYTITSAVNETVASLATGIGATLNITGGTFTATYGTGPGTRANHGTISVHQGATLLAGGIVNNPGTLDANGGTIVITGAVISAGKATIEGTGEIEFAGASSANVSFAANSQGILKLDLPSKFTGTVAGLANGDYIDLPNINFADNPAIFFSSSTHLLTVTDNVSHVTDTIKISGTPAGTFTGKSDGSGGTLITDPPAAFNAPGHASVPQLVQAMASFEAGHGGLGSSVAIEFYKPASQGFLACGEPHHR